MYGIDQKPAIERMMHLSASVSCLRKKLASFAGQSFQIKTSNGKGYELTSPLAVKASRQTGTGHGVMKVKNPVLVH